MSRPPVFPAEQKVRIVLSILAGEITAADAARQFKVIDYSRAALREAGVTAHSVLLVCMPYMQRRAYATCRMVWPEVTPVCCASEPIAFDAYTKSIGDEALVIDQLVGDLHRVMEYPKLGFAVSQDVPEGVLGAFDHLVARGYDSKVLRS